MKKKDWSTCLCSLGGRMEHEQILEQIKVDIIQKRVLGKSGLEVSSLGLGCMGISFSYNTLDNMVLHSAIE